MNGIPESTAKKLESVDTFQLHRDQPAIPLEIYAHWKRRSAAKRVLGRTRIYLDQKYWNFCRDAILERPQPEHIEIWRLLRDLCDRGLIACPICAPVYVETLKLESDSRILVARAADRLSLRVCIQPPHYLEIFELSHWIWKNLLGDQALEPMLHYAFAPVSCVLGAAHPENPSLSAHDNLAMAKHFIDCMDALGLEDRMLMMADRPRSGEDDSAFQRQQTEDARRHAGDFSTYAGAYAIEIRGSLAPSRPQLEDFARHVLGMGRDLSMFGAARSAKELAQDFMAVITSGLVLGRIGAELPTIQIASALCAAVRWNRDQKFRKGDLWDFQHAAAALAYCDAFFTDRRLANLIKSRPANLVNLYKCEVISDDAAVLEYLRRLARG